MVLEYLCRKHRERIDAGKRYIGDAASKAAKHFERRTHGGIDLCFQLKVSSTKIQEWNVHACQRARMNSA